MAQFLVTYHGMGHPTPDMMEAGREAFRAVSAWASETRKRRLRTGSRPPLSV